MKQRNRINLLGTVGMLMSAVMMMVMSSYAWMTVSTSPVAEGMQVMVGGGNTIMLAADLTDENGVHYPGDFSADLNLSQLVDMSALSKLQPVSTADGLRWYIPEYYSSEDEAVQNHLAMMGAAKPINEFTEDKALSYADNCTRGDSAGEGADGRYLYLDFWVVSPEKDYELHVASSEEQGLGSFVIGWQDVSRDDSGMTLVSAPAATAESIRVGFLVNQNTAETSGYDGKYPILRGMYQEPGQALEDFYYDLNSFTIYEPNGDAHSENEALDGKYVTTSPIGRRDGELGLLNISDRLCVQLSNLWDSSAQSEFAASVIEARNHGVEDTPEAMREYFYITRLQKQVSRYVNTGMFITDTDQLYHAGVERNGVVTADVSTLPRSGASNTRIIKLEKNVPQRIRMFIWMEGQDIDCTGSTGTCQLAMNIELAGATVN